jgi:hypothetical protein
MKGGDKPDVSSLFSVENGRCIRIPLPGLSNTQRFNDATITTTAQRRFTDNDCTHCMRDRASLPMAGSRHPNAGRAQSAPYGPETGFQCIYARRTYQHTTLNDFTNDDETDVCTHRMRDRALPSGGWGATPRRISESAPFGPATGSQHIGARRTHLFTCFHIHLVTLTLTAATDKICGLKPLSTIYTVENAEGRLVL